MKNVPASNSTQNVAGQSYAPDWSRYPQLQNNEERREVATAIVHRAIESATSSYLKSQKKDNDIDHEDSELFNNSSSTDTPPPINDLSIHSDDDTSHSDLSFPPPPPELLREIQDNTDDLSKTDESTFPDTAVDKLKLSDFRIDSTESHDLTYDETSSVTSPVADELTFALDLSSSMNASKGSEEEGFEHPEAWTGDAGTSEVQLNQNTGAIQKNGSNRTIPVISMQNSYSEDKAVDSTIYLEDITSPDLTLSASGSEDEISDDKAHESMELSGCISTEGQENGEQSTVSKEFSKESLCNTVPESHEIEDLIENNKPMLDSSTEIDSTKITHSSTDINVDSDPAQIIGQNHSPRSSESDITSANTDAMFTLDSSSAIAEIEPDASASKDEVDKNTCNGPKSDENAKSDEKSGKLSTTPKDGSMEDEVFTTDDDIRMSDANSDNLYFVCEEDELPKSQEPELDENNVKKACVDIDSEGDVEYSGLEEINQRFYGKITSEDSVDASNLDDLPMDPASEPLEDTYTNIEETIEEEEENEPTIPSTQKNETQNLPENIIMEEIENVDEARESEPKIESKNSEGLVDKKDECENNVEHLDLSVVEDSDPLKNSDTIDFKNKNDAKIDEETSEQLHSDVADIDLQLVNDVKYSKDTSDNTSKDEHQSDTSISNELRKLAEEIVKNAIAEAKDRLKEKKCEDAEKKDVIQQDIKESSTFPDKQEIPMKEKLKDSRKPWYRRAGSTLRNLCSCSGTWSKESESDSSK